MNKKKVTLVHCYSDNNAGDLGIILTTLQKIIRVAKSPVELNCISTYNYDDPRFNTEHVQLNMHLNKYGSTGTYPSLFGLVDRTKSFKWFRLLKDFSRFMFLLISCRSKFFQKLLLTSEEYKSFCLLKDSDLVISKGGSFFCDDSSKFGFLAFFRLWYICLLSFMLEKKSIILCQSLGPLNSKISKFWGNFLLNRFSAVVIREDSCLVKYPYINKISNFYVNNDIVFSQNLVKECSNKIKSNTVGVTIKYVSNDSEVYKEIMIQIIEYLIQRGYYIKIIPQVPLDGDIAASVEIYNRLPDHLKDMVLVIEKSLLVEEVIREYQSLSFVVGTRLHSCIYAWSVGVPAINISYHGTKSIGIYSNLGLESWVLDYTFKKEIDKFIVIVQSIEQDRESILRDVNEKIGNYDRQLNIFLDKMIN